MTIGRRAALRAAGLAATGGLAALAGCPGGGDGTATTEEPDVIESEPNYRGWFDGVDNYRGTVDRRDAEQVRVRVGVEGDTGAYRFGPAAVAVSPDTSVIWEWTGQGGAHDVVSESDDFDSGEPVESDSATFTFTYQSPAVYRYYCSNHRDRGMRGAVFVDLDG